MSEANPYQVSFAGLPGALQIWVAGLQRLDLYGRFGAATAFDLLSGRGLAYESLSRGKDQKLEADQLVAGSMDERPAITIGGTAYAGQSQTTSRNTSSHRDSEKGTGQLCGLRELLESPLPCTFWNSGEPGEKASGVLLRDTSAGLIVRTTSRMNFSNSSLHGQTGSGIEFTILNATNLGMMSDKIWGKEWYFGRLVERPNQTFRRMTLWMDELPALLDPRTHRETTNLARLDFKPISVGAVTVAPMSSVLDTRWKSELYNYRVELTSTRARSTTWWREQWINPLEFLLTSCVRLPSKVTVISFGFGGEESVPRPRDAFYGQSYWPTLDLDALVPTDRSPAVHEPLLNWSDPEFRLGQLVKGFRRLRKNEVAFEALKNYRDTIYGSLSERHEFLNLVQAAEALHTGTHGRFVSDAATRVGKLNERMARLKEKGVNGRDRTAIKRALQAERPREFPLERRLADLADGLHHAPGLAWFSWVQDARNKLSHGEPLPTSDFTLSETIGMLSHIIEFRILVLVGLGETKAARLIERRP